jgi:hypothetical protein
MKGSCTVSPAVTTLPATNVTQSSALLRLTVNPGGAPSTAWFDWSLQGGVPASTTQIDAGSSSQSVELYQTLSGLECGEEYSYRAYAENDFGERASGLPVTLQTAACSGLGGSQEVELLTNGGFESGTNGWTRSGDFRIANASCPRSGAGYAFLAEADFDPGNNLNGTLDRVVAIPGDASNATFRFRLSITSDDSTTQPRDVLTVWIYDSSGSTPLDLLASYSNDDANDGCGPSFYGLKSFDVSEHAGDTIRLRFFGTANATLPTVFRIDDVSVTATVPAGTAPHVTTDPASGVGPSSALLRATIDPNGLQSEVWFEWDDDTSLSFETERLTVGGGTTPQLVAMPLYGLDCDTTYYFEAFGENAAGDDDGIRRSFQTDACDGEPPVADTDPAISVSASSATLRADIWPNGLPTSAWFAWGTSSALGSSTASRGVGAGTSPVDLSQTITDLACGTTYYFEAHASNPGGSDDGTTESFTTVSCSVATQSDLLLYVDEWQGCNGAEPAVLLGWVMPDGASPIVHVRSTDGSYSATVDTSVEGPVHMVGTGLEPGFNYIFVAETTVGGVPVISNQVVTRWLTAECEFVPSLGEVPHRPILWAGPAFCEAGVPRLPLHWTPVLGAESYQLQRAPLFGSSQVISDLPGTSFVDGGLAPGNAGTYQLLAVNGSGTRGSRVIGFHVPANVCGEPAGSPGAFSVSASAPYCEDGDEGVFEVTWTPSSGALPAYRLLHFYDHRLPAGRSSDSDFVDEPGSASARGHVLRVVVQAQSSSQPGSFREVSVARSIPGGICGLGTLPPAVATSSVTTVYASDSRAVLRGEVNPNGRQTSVSFEWGLTASYGEITPTRDIGNGHDILYPSEVLENLTCGQTYHYRIVATNALGASVGEDRVITTDPCTDTMLFEDGFESGDLGAWGGSAGNSG